MRRANQRLSGIIVWIIIVGIISNLGLFSSLFRANSSSAEPVTEDTYMTTEGYHTSLEIQKDNSYTMTESIDVNFQTSRHGIYRYIPYKGIITEAQEDGDLVDIPYYGEFSNIKSTETLEVTSENGNKVFRFGDEDEMVIDRKNYTFSYKITQVTSKGYENAYYNVFPAGWRNAIPAGSTFSVSFPAEFDHEALRLYWGSYGEQKDASDITELSWSGNTLTGVLKEALPVGAGMTFFVPMEDGYFQNVSNSWKMNLPFIIVTTAIMAVLLILFFLFGRDTPIIPSVQFQPPAGLDSAAVGYIIDGSVSDEDVTSLFVFWADRGFIKIRETQNRSIAFRKIRDLPADAPEYAKLLFDKVFGRGKAAEGEEVLVSSLKYKLSSTFVNTKAQLKKNFKNLYTPASKTARFGATILSMIPMFYFAYLMYTLTFANILVLAFAAAYAVGLILFNMTVDFWYSRAKRSRVLWGSAAAALCIVPPIVLFLIYGIRMIRGSVLNLLPAMICLLIASPACMIFSGFMKKRSEQCVEWMGYLAGLRDFIETAELERMQVIAKDSPELFYHILPFAYVFGLSDILMDKMKELSLPSPEWYETSNGSPFFDYYMMHYLLHTNMRQVAATLSTPKPAETSSGSGGFSGGGFSGGGFSGGGFGGGGGGSW